ncbi:MAG: hypothetical protein AAB367_01475 [Patescibacteria group bacterium]
MRFFKSLFKKPKVLWLAGVFIVLLIYGAPGFLLCDKSFEQKLYLAFNNIIAKTVFYILLIPTPLIVLWWREMRGNISLWKKIISSIAVLVLMGISYLLFYALVLCPYCNIGGGVAHVASGGIDRPRVSFMSNMRITMEVYYDENNNRYPSTLDQLVPKYLEKSPKDHITGEPYDYRVSEDGQQYVIRSLLGVAGSGCKSKLIFAPISLSVNQSSLKGDADGEVLGLNCDDPYYCLSEKW